MKGRIAVLQADRGEFELRAHPVPEVEPGPVQDISEAVREADGQERTGGARRVTRAAVAIGDAA